METPEMPRPAAHDGNEEPPAGVSAGGEDSPQQQRAQRLAALSALAAAPPATSSGGESSQLPPVATAVRRPRWQRMRVGLAVVVLLGVAAAAIWKLHPLTTPTGAVSPPQGPVQMLPNADGGMYCISDLAFTPQSRHLAVLGNEYPCFGPHGVSTDVLSPPARANQLFYTGGVGP